MFEAVSILKYPKSRHVLFGNGANKYTMVSEKKAISPPMIAFQQIAETILLVKILLLSAPYFSNQMTR